jgi:hypothetical protein
LDDYKAAFPYVVGLFFIPFIGGFLVGLFLLGMIHMDVQVLPGPAGRGQEAEQKN